MTTQDDQDAMWRALERAIERDHGLLGRLRGLPTQVRTALLVSAALLPALVVATLHPEAIEAARAPLALLVVAGASALLAPLGQPRWTSRRALLGALAALGPLLGALLFCDHGLIAPPSAARCFLYGALWATPSVVLAQLASRTALRGTVDLALLAGVCGIGAAIMLDLHCASRHLGHLILGHASVGCAWAGLCALAARKLSTLYH